MNFKIIRYISTVLFMMIISGFLCTNTFAYKTGKKWKTNVVNIYINPSGGSSGSYDAIKNAAQTWTDVSTSSFTFYTAETSYDGSFWGKLDGMNFINFGSVNSKSAIAQTKSWYSIISGFRYVSEKDIKFNTQYFQFSTDGSTDKYDVQNVATHELGHVLELLDLYGRSDTEKTMYGRGIPGETKKRDLHQDDIDGITYLYP